MVGAPTHRKRHEHIQTNDADNLAAALNFTRQLEREPNLFITIQWKHAECPIPVATRTQRFLNLAGTWLKRATGAPAVWAYAREVGRLKGEHLHLVIHVPPRHSAAFKRAAFGWIEMEATGEVRASAARIMPITKGTLSSDLKRYLLKEGTDEVRTAHWVPNTAKYRRTGGVVLGKRIKVSHSIGPTARRRPLDDSGHP
ncbi:hypothetical protein M9M90_09750 [Phenylobacterium sp. LH3H17]|uniref:hypothetical protein n=1 Tax=Phenylobacterium sp. LH3H17 TaxID=2903901 RepID=UPI0020C9AAFC|nr:hypothetical protein [Phenylobacterium sp. LH3H17]UTP41436.1 hypothetical protein M9M90_09750 [Phenylobacterium sp. LH3H17]